MRVKFGAKTTNGRNGAVVDGLPTPPSWEVQIGLSLRRLRIRKVFFFLGYKIIIRVDERSRLGLGRKMKSRKGQNCLYMKSTLEVQKWLILVGPNLKQWAEPGKRIMDVLGINLTRLGIICKTTNYGGQKSLVQSLREFFFSFKKDTWTIFYSISYSKKE